MGWSDGVWDVETAKAPILDTGKMEECERRLGIPMPEIMFGNNALKIRHIPSRWSISFDAISALDLVDKTGQGAGRLQLAHSDEWKRSKGENAYKVHRPFDWTYSTVYRGSEGTPSKLKPAAPTVEIPFDKLKEPAPILFFDEVPLYEDELGDFGLTTYTAKVRVMPGCIYVLARMYMRVDDVAFRIRDTRVYIDLTRAHVIEEYSVREDSFDNVRAAVPVGIQDYTHLLRDQEWIARTLPLVSREINEARIDV